MIFRKIKCKILIFMVKYFLLIQKSECDSLESLSEIKIADVPYTVYISPVGCTGALIHQLWVLSAAHCFIFSDEVVKVFFGAQNSKSSLYTIDSEQIFYHPDIKTVYDNPYDIQALSKYDIALIKLIKPAQLSQTVKFLKLETEPWPKNVENRKCLSAGYGYTSTMNSTLHQLLFESYQNKQICKCFDSTYTICAKHAKDADLACPGDSGAILMCDGKGVAIVSNGVPSQICTDKENAMNELEKNKCAKDEYLFVFTYIYPNLEWIKQTQAGTLPKRNYKSSNAEARYNLQQYYNLLSIISVLLITFLWIQERRLILI